MSPARVTHLEETYFRHWATVHVFRRCFWGRVLSVWRHKGCSSKSLHQAALEEMEKHSADGYRAVERFQPAVCQVAQDVQAVLGKQAHKLRLVVDQGVGHGILQVLVLLSSIKRSCMVGDEKNTCAFTTSNVFFSCLPSTGCLHWRAHSWRCRPCSMWRPVSALHCTGWRPQTRGVYWLHTPGDAKVNTRCPTTLPTLWKMGPPTSHQSFKQDRVKVIRALLLSVVDGDEVSVLVNAQSLKPPKKEGRNKKNN